MQGKSLSFFFIQVGLEILRQLVDFLSLIGPDGKISGSYR